MSKLDKIAVKIFNYFILVCVAAVAGSIAFVAVRLVLGV